MNQREDGQTRFWIRNPDSLGNLVDQRLIEAANRVWERARLTVMRYLADDTEASEILEAAVDSASRALASHQSIQFPEAYLLRSVARERKHLLLRERGRITEDSLRSLCREHPEEIPFETLDEDTKRLLVADYQYGTPRRARRGGREKKKLLEHPATHVQGQ